MSIIPLYCISVGGHLRWVNGLSFSRFALFVTSRLSIETVNMTRLGTMKIDDREPEFRQVRPASHFQMKSQTRLFFRKKVYRRRDTIPYPERRTKRDLAQFCIFTFFIAFVGSGKDARSLRGRSYSSSISSIPSSLRTHVIVPFFWLSLAYCRMR